jgi:hypothetical protein
MHSFFIKILILLRCKPDQAFLVYINPEWLIGGNSDVDSEVEFISVYEQGI